MCAANAVKMILQTNIFDSRRSNFFCEIYQHYIINNIERDHDLLLLESGYLFHQPTYFKNSLSILQSVLKRWGNSFIIVIYDARTVN